MQNVNITWTLFQDIVEDRATYDVLYIFKYGGKYNYTQYYLNVDKVEAIKRFEAMLNNRSPHEAEAEGWDAEAVGILFSKNGEAWTGNIGDQMRDISDFFLGGRAQGV